MRFYVKLVAVLSIAFLLQIGVGAARTVWQLPNYSLDGNVSLGKAERQAISQAQERFESLDPVTQWVIVEAFNWPFDSTDKDLT